MALVRKLSPALVVVAILLLAGIQPGAAPEFGDWEQPVMLPGPINDAPTFGAVVTRDGLTMYCTRGIPPATDLYVARRASVDEPWGVPYTSELQPDGTFGPAVLDEQLSLPFVPPGIGDMEGRPMVRFDGREMIDGRCRAAGAGGCRAAGPRAGLRTRRMAGFLAAGAGAGSRRASAPAVGVGPARLPQPVHRSVVHGTAVCAARGVGGRPGRAGTGVCGKVSPHGRNSCRFAVRPAQIGPGASRNCSSRSAPQASHRNDPSISALGR